MEINILLTILLTTILLGGLFCLGGKICLIEREQINDYVTVKYNLKNALYQRAVKLAWVRDYLLNIIIPIVDKKATQRKLFQSKNHRFEG